MINCARTPLDKKFLLLLWPVVNLPSFHHGSCQTLKSKILRNLEVLAFKRWNRGERENRTDYHVFTYILEQVPPVHLADNIPEYICLTSFMYRTLQQKVQCAIDSFFSLYLCPWTSLDVRQPKLLAMVLNSTEVESWMFYLCFQKAWRYLDFQKSVSANASSPPCLMTLLAQQ